jgi:hypothetical protein
VVVEEEVEVVVVVVVVVAVPRLLVKDDRKKIKLVAKMKRLEEMGLGRALDV